METNNELTHYLVERDVLTTPALIEAFYTINRADFVDEQNKGQAYADTALPIGHGATISQPYTVAFMVELLGPQPGDRVLDVGSGSGYSTALLAHVVGKQGQVFGIELIPELVVFGKEHLKKYDLPQARIFQAGKQLGLPDKAPFDKILVSAAATAMPQELVNQLRPGGALVVPIGYSIWRVQKKPDGELAQEEYPGFVFVPLH